VLADFVDLHDVGMLQAGHGFHFELEACQLIWPRMHTAQDHL